jgi:hypothetical protein
MVAIATRRLAAPQRGTELTALATTNREVFENDNMARQG